MNLKTNIIFIGNGGSSELTTLKTVIDRTLIIPSYQRPYAWNTENIEDLFNTIKNSIEEDTFSQIEHKQPAFFGSVIFSTKNHTEYFIIDGQQRITSFLLILRVMEEKLREEKLELNNSLSTLDQEVDKADQKGDRKTAKDILTKIRKKQNTLDKYTSLIETINNLLNKTNISRLTHGKTELSSKDLETENEYINYIAGKNFNSSADFKKNKDSILNRINDIMENIDIPSSESKEDEIYKQVVNYILDSIKFCLLTIQGEHSEEYAIDVFNTLNSTGEPLTGFEVFKSKIIQFSGEKQEIERDLFDIESSIKLQKPRRKDLIVVTGKLLLYLAIHRDDYGKNKLSDKNFKEQNAYIKSNLTKDNFLEVLKDIKSINHFVVENWLPTKSTYRSHTQELSTKNSIFALKGFDFLREIKHDRVIPVIYKWSKEHLKDQFDSSNYKKIIELCSAFSCLWRMAHNGGASGIDQEYLTIAKAIKKDPNQAQAIIRERLEIKFPKEDSWRDQVIHSYVNKNKSLTKFLLALISLEDISLYHSKEWVSFPLSNDRNHRDKIGNTILIPKTEEKDFKADLKNNLLELLKDSSFNRDLYPYTKVEKWDIEKINQRTKQIGQLIWEKLFKQILNQK